jgi:hypothetical protein
VEVNRRSHLRVALGCVLGLAFLPWAPAQQAAAPGDLPTAESILDRYVEVTGGAAAYKSRTSEVTTGTLTIAAAGITGQLRVLAKPGLLRTTIELPGVGVIDRGVKDGVAWESNPITGPRIVEGFEGKLMVAGAQPGATGRWREMYSAVNTAGIEDVAGKPAYRVIHALGTDGSLTGFYGVDSGLLVKLAIGPGVEQLYEEYANLGGILTPTRVVTVAPGQRSVITFTSVEANVEIPDERFDPPESVQALLQ